MPGPVPHPGFQKQQFTRSVGLFLGGLGPAFLAPSRGPGAPGPELKIYIFNYCQRAATLKTEGFSKEGTFGRSFGRILLGQASTSVPRPADGRPEANCEALPIRIRPKLGPKVPSFTKTSFLGGPVTITDSYNAQSVGQARPWPGIRSRSDKKS